MFGGTQRIKGSQDHSKTPKFTKALQLQETAGSIFTIQSQLETWKNCKNQNEGGGGKEECHVAALVGVMKQSPEKERSREWPELGLQPTG